MAQQRMNPMAFQADLTQVLDAGKGSVVIEGELSRHQYLTKEKTDDMALQEMKDNHLNQKPITGFQFSVKDARVISGAGVGTIMEQIIASGFKPNKDNSATYVECRCGRRMPKLYATENGQIVDISKEFEGQTVSYQGPVQVSYSLSKGKNDGRIYLNVDGVLFATKPDIWNPEEGGGRDVSAAFAPTAFYGQTAAPAQPAGFAAQAAAPAQQAPVQQAAPAQQAPAGFAQSVAPAAPMQGAPVQQPAQPAQPWSWPQ